MDQLERIRRSERAASLLVDEVLQAAFDDLRGDLLARWQAAATVEARERLWADQKAVNQVEERLKSWALDKQMIERNAALDKAAQ